MNQTLSQTVYVEQGWDRVRLFLELIGRLREITEPITTPEGLRKSLELLIGVAELLGINPAIITQFRHILANPRTFELVLAIVRFLHGLTDNVALSSKNVVIRFADSGPEPERYSTQAFLDWLPLVIQLLELLRQLRGK